MSFKWRARLPYIGLAVLAVVTLGAIMFAFLAPQPEVPVSAKVQEVASAPPTAAIATGKVTVAAFIGDSYTGGAGASNPNKRWTTLVAKQRGWFEKNYGLGGTGYVTEAGAEGCGKAKCPNYAGVLDEVAKAEPNVLVISGGRNDRWSSESSFAAATTDLFQQAKAKLPNARIFVTTPVWDDEQAPAEIERMRGQVTKAATAAGITVLDIGEPLQGQPSITAADGFHPNDAGYALLAAATNKALVASGF